MENQICTDYLSNIYCSSTTYFKLKVTYRARKLKVNEYQKWDAFVAGQRLGNVHQTSKWGDFQRLKEEAKQVDNGWDFWIFAVFKEKIRRGDSEKAQMEAETLIGGALVMRRKMGYGKNWHYIAKGPIFADDLSGNSINDAFLALMESIDENARSDSAVFLRVESDFVKKGPEDCGVRLELNWKEFRKAHAHYQPENTVMVDLAGSEEQILAKMKPKGRYNIKVAQKKGVVVSKFDAESEKLEWAVGQYAQILTETTTRDGFAAHGKDYYLNMIGGLGPEQCQLYLAEYEEEVIAGLIVTFYRDLAIYYFGASSNKHRNVMAPYLLQWEAMKEARSRGVRWYDFLGVAPEIAPGNGDEGGYDSKHEWAGVTEFKLKFGGARVDFLPAMEKVYKPFWYWAMVLRKKLKG
ncbi:peptidoglycan bridge formation glycyltransferase FemA/FemB family protein [Candidatus Peregrinibacteria bacterium]|nr:peptidoglycan bridge formation glycyltransferase FemA/FemB family protein [Candidatus Peregrinibacteria bacterium]